MLDKMILLLVLVLPLCSAGLLALLYRVNLRIFRRLTMAAISLPLFPLLYLVYQAVQQGSLAKYELHYNSRVSIFSFSYGIDSVSLWLSIFTSIVLLAAVLSGVYIKKRHKQFYMLVLLVQGVMLHIYLSRDALLLCAALLLMAFLFMLLLGIWGKEDAVRTARRFAYWQLAGIFCVTMSCIFLLGISSDYLQSSTVILGEQPLQLLEQYVLEEANQNQRLLAFVMLLLGLVCFLPVIGLHRLFLDIYRSGHLVVAMIYSAAIGTIGIYLFYRIGLTYFADFMLLISKPIMWIAAIQWLFSCISLWHQKDARGWLACSIWGQYSLFILLMLANSQLGLPTMWLHLFSFLMIASLLSGLLAAIEERTKTLEFKELRGQLKQVPFVSGLLVIVIIAWLGLPGLSHFLGSYHALLLSFQTSRWITVCLVLGMISSVAFAVRKLFYMQQGQTDARINKVTDLRFIEAFPAIILLTFVIVMGFYPIILVDLMEFELHQLYAYWQQIETKIFIDSGNYLDVLRFDSSAWQLPVIVSVVMSLVIWLVNHKQTNVFRMLLWQTVYHALTLVVVLSSADALSVELNAQRIVLIAIWYAIMIIGSYSMLKAVLGHSHAMLAALHGLYYRQPRHALVLLLFMLALMSAPLTAGFSFQLSMIELWSSHGQYGLILLWLVAHALMATIPLEYIIQMYMNKEQCSSLMQDQQAKQKGYSLLGYCSLLALLVLAFWI